MSRDYGTRPVKRNRRTKAKMDELRDTIISVVERDNPMTFCGLFNQLVVLDTIPAAMLRRLVRECVNRT